ncbi:transcription elongation factor GreA [Kitasatospora albolonga]|uniref:transcription elongation factor GreA n=1 Tax=Kitasatospora albolonga TaxID=68173 RepID=UPI0031F19372
MTQTSENVTWLTQAGYDKLKAELEYMTTTWRSEIVQKIEAAREEGDLKENAGYHAARDDQGKGELRIRQLTQLLERAKVGEAPAGADAVAPGTVVTVAFDGDEDDTMKFLIGSREMAGTTDIDVYSPQSPLGLAIDGKKIGDEAHYELPNGKRAMVKIIAVEAHTG